MALLDKRRRPATYLLAFALAAGGVAVGLPNHSLQAHAASATGGFAVRGLGAQQCSALTAEAEGEGATAVLQASAGWLAGYLSQHNRLAPDTYEAMPIIDNVVVARLALNLCRSNPDALFESVAASLIRSFEDVALSEESEIVEIEHEGARAVLRRGVLRRVQQELIGAAAADGQYGPQSRQALIDFQASRGITQSGVPDPETLIHLFVLDEPQDDAQSQ